MNKSSGSVIVFPSPSPRPPPLAERAGRVGRSEHSMYISLWRVPFGAPLPVGRTEQLMHIPKFPRSGRRSHSRCPPSPQSTPRLRSPPVRWWPRRSPAAPPIRRSVGRFFSDKGVDARGGTLRTWCVVLGKYQWGWSPRPI